ncbi:MAG: Pseudouridine synthase [Parachlamydiales bacterium]|nr:Pseudouridine synthase [Parachlamydiales bacterium]
MKLTIPESMRAIDALRRLFPDSSRRTLQHWIKGGRFTVDDQPLERDDRVLEQGQVLEAQETFQAKQAWDLKILYEDRYLIVIDKPENLLSVPLDGPSSKRHALGILQDHYQTDQIFAVHRIDRETSGVLIFARGFASREKFDVLFERHDLHREYFAVLEGRLPENRGRWECSLVELPSFDVKISYDPTEGKQAITHYEVLRRSAKYTYARLRLETGRKHQIRVHCKEAGCPVLGDLRYGATENPIRRLCLHAREIAFQHPFTGQYLRLTSPIPPPFKKIGATDSLYEIT